MRPILSTDDSTKIASWKQLDYGDIFVLMINSILLHIQSVRQNYFCFVRLPNNHVAVLFATQPLIFQNEERLPSKVSQTLGPRSGTKKIDSVIRHHFPKVYMGKSEIRLVSKRSKISAIQKNLEASMTVPCCAVHLTPKTNVANESTLLWKTAKPIFLNFSGFFLVSAPKYQQFGP